MGAAIGLREDFGSAELRALARTVKDAGQARRLLALAVIYDGGRRTEAARIGSVGLQIIRDWVLRFIASISSIFQARFHFLIRLSRVIASRMSLWVSNHTRR